MKKVVIVLTVMSMGYIALAESVSSLYQEFLRRDSVKLTLDEGAAMNFLKLVKYPSQGIAEINVLTPSTSFVFREKTGPICLGDMVQGSLLCKTALGLVSYALASDQTFEEVTAPTKLYTEFQERDQKTLTDTETAAVQFLRTMAYPVIDIIKMDTLSAETFVFLDRGGDICFGDTKSLIVRCKNELGITGVNFQGDSD